MPTLIVNKNRIGPIRGRHPWVFSGALQSIPEGLASGEIVRLNDEAGHFLAQGYFNSYSQIAVRLWSWQEDEVVDEHFFVSRFQSAAELRAYGVTGKKTNAYRLVNGEGDLLPGLIVDKYADYLSIQFHTAGIAHWKKEIVAALVEVFKPVGIYERSELKVKSIGYGSVPERVKIIENGFHFWVDIKGGQKTGFFLDQRDKRQALTKYVAEKKVLNCFSYTGGFSVYALAAGAKQVVSVDSSDSALRLAEENVLLNTLSSPAEFILADVKDYLADREPGEFDVIILDPPAFVKDRHKIKEGLAGYRSINEMAWRLLPVGGWLVSCSCSAHVSLSDFRYVLSEAAGRAGRTVQIVETFTHGADHPQLLAFTEGEYLKCVFARVVR